MTSALGVHEEHSGPCPTCAGTGDVLRAGSGLTFRMSRTPGGTSRCWSRPCADSVALFLGNGLNECVRVPVSDCRSEHMFERMA